MRTWALIENGTVINTIIWEGPDAEPMDFGEGITYVEYPIDGVSPSIGWIYDGNTFNAPPPTAEEIKEQEELAKQQNLATAQGEYERASEHITSLQQQLDDEDYSEGATEESLSAEKKAWTAYRVKLRAYIKDADGSKTLPLAPDA